MALSDVERKRIYRARIRERENARHDSGAPKAADEFEPLPDGAYELGNGAICAKYGHFAARDGTFPPVPADIAAMDLPVYRGVAAFGVRKGEVLDRDYGAKQLAEARDRVAHGRPAWPSADRSILFAE